MKSLFFVTALLFSLNTLSQSVIEATTATSLSPFATATRIMESSTVTALAPFASTIATAQARGVAGREQIKDELVALNDDMVAGRVKTIEDVRQPALKELFKDIIADQEQMKNINSLIDSGSELHKISTAVTIALMIQ